MLKRLLLVVLIVLWACSGYTEINIETYSNAFTLTVAASNSMIASGADYVCDGIDDQVEINAALQKIASNANTTGVVQLLEGDFTTSAPIYMLTERTVLRGAGDKSTTITLANNANCNMIEFDCDGIFWLISDLRLVGNKNNNTTGHGIYVAADTGIKDINMYNLSIGSFAEDNIHALSSWGMIGDNLVLEYSKGCGLYINGDSGGYSSKFSQCKIFYNDSYQLHLFRTTKTSTVNARFQNCEFGPALNSTTVLKIDGSGNLFTNCNVTNNSKTGVTLIDIAGSRNIFTNAALGGASDTYAFKIASGAKGNYIHGTSSFTLALSTDRVTYQDLGADNVYDIPMRWFGSGWEASNKRFYNPSIGRHQDETIYMYFDEGSANKPGFRYNSSTNTIQFSNDGTTWQDIPTS